MARYRCRCCQRSFSAATTSPKRWHKKRHLRKIIVSLLTGGMTQREVARVLGINRKTVVRQYRFSHGTAEEKLHEQNRKFTPSQEVEFDDLETFEHSKLKPLSVTMMVEAKTRRILGFETAQMPAKGTLARLSRKKYGPRKDGRPEARRKLFTKVKKLVAEDAVIRSDSNPHYPKDVKKHFPKAYHQKVLGGRAAVVGQGELKKKTWDPIFSLNHTYAMLRAHISRLARKTWCTTKKMEELHGHIALYALEHNRRLRTI